MRIIITTTSSENAKRGGTTALLPLTIKANKRQAYLYHTIACARNAGNEVVQPVYHPSQHQANEMISLSTEMVVVVVVVVAFTSLARTLG